MRLIDADALKEKVEAIVFGCNLMGDEYHCRLSDTIDYVADVLIDDAPSIDLVRCGECKYQNKSENEREPWNLCDYRPWIYKPISDDYFCGDGERRSDETEALWTIALIEAVRLVEQTLQLRLIVKDTGARDNAYAEFIKSLKSSDREFVRSMLEEFERKYDE